MKLRTVKSTLQRVNASPGYPPTQSDKRMAGSRLQARRLRLWTAKPTCAICQRLTDYPGGFELDHIIRLDQGGADVESNCQVLCVWYDHFGIKQGCHVDKTNSEVKAGANLTRGGRVFT
jgi:5-methylcytosine-specific restriction protein A